MIFRRDNGKAVDIESFKERCGRRWRPRVCMVLTAACLALRCAVQRVLRSNDYRTDPYSHDNPFAAICSRGDLAGSAGGCYDTKVR